MNNAFYSELIKMCQRLEISNFFEQTPTSLKSGKRDSPQIGFIRVTEPGEAETPAPRMKGGE